MGRSSPSLLLHVCCGPCATTAIQRLRPAYALTLFFANSNISPAEEYRRRLAAAEQLARHFRLPLVEDAYDHDAWLARVRGLEDQPEGGRRCEACFAYNLGRAAGYAAAHGFPAFTTTLTVSPHKDTATLFRVGRPLDRFLAVDFRQDDGFRRSVALSRQLGLYRQHYCGCEFSRRPPAAPPGGSAAG